jgi:hypothetical protein
LALAGQKSADKEYREEIVDRGFALVCPNHHWQISEPLVILAARMAFDRHLDYKFVYIAPGSKISASKRHSSPTPTF